LPLDGGIGWALFAACLPHSFCSSGCSSLPARTR